MGGTSEQSDDAWRVRDLLSPPYGLGVVWLVLPGLLAMFGFGLLPLRSWDYWWHITIGRLIDHHGAVPDANHFLYTIEADAPSFIQPWLSQLWLFELHELWGVAAPLLARNLLAGLVIGALGVIAISRTRSPVRGALLAILALALCAPYIDARTHLFVWPIFVLLLVLGYGIRRGRIPIFALFAFPLAAIAWANLHGSFFLVAALCLAFGAAEGVDRLRDRETASGARLGGFGAALAASLVAPLVNPRGGDIYGYVVDLAQDPEVQSTITEWMPATPANPPVIGALFYLVVLGAVYLFWRERRRLDAADAFLFGGLALLSLFSARGLLWFGLALPFVVSTYVARAEGEIEESAPIPLGLQLAHVGLVAALLIGALVVQPGNVVHRSVITSLRADEVRTEAPLAGFVPAETPVEQTEVLRAYRADLRLFHDQRYAGFLMFHLSGLAPQPMVFVDQRIELPGEEVWRLYEAVIETSAWRGVFEQYGVDAAVLNLERQRPLVAELRESNNWRLSHEDAHNALFIAER